MEKDCCTINVKEIDNGFRIEITGDNIKECCQTVIKKAGSCCDESVSKDDKKDVK